MALEIRVFQRYSGKSAYVVGKTAVMSAGVTIFSAFECADRFLSPDTTLLIHERHIEKTITLQGPIKSCRQVIREELAAQETAARVEGEDFEHFVRGSGRRGPFRAGEGELLSNGAGGARSSADCAHHRLKERLRSASNLRNSL